MKLSKEAKTLTEDLGLSEIDSLSIELLVRIIVALENKIPLKVA